MASDLVTMIIDWECGDLDEDDSLALFSELIKSGQAWQLQGSYGRMAQSLIEGGYLSDTGEILSTEE